jgi:hypothetical protein
MNATDWATFLSEGDLKMVVSPASRPLLSEFAVSAKVGGAWQAEQPAPPPPCPVMNNCRPLFSSVVKFGRLAPRLRFGAVALNTVA